MTCTNGPTFSDSVNLGSNPSPPATRSADVSCISGALSDLEQSELSEQTAHIGRTETGTALFDVIEVQIAPPHAERVMTTRLTEADAGWFIMIAIARRGVENQFYTTRPSLPAHSRVPP